MSTIGILRSVQESEVELMRQWRNAPSVRANMYTRHEISPEEHIAWWQRIRDRTDHQYFVYETSGTACGIVSFNAIDLENRNSAWAFYASPNAPRGTGSKMEFLALEHAFGELNLHKLQCEVLAFNVPVLRLHQKFGFQREGIFRQHHWTETGFVDVHRLGLLRHEWNEQRPHIQVRLK